MEEYIEMREESMEDVLSKEQALLASKHILLSDKIDRVMAHTRSEESRLKETICEEGPYGKIKLPVSLNIIYSFSNF